MKIENTSITKSLKGSFKVSDDFDYKKELRKKRENKFSSFLDIISTKHKSE